MVGVLRAVARFFQETIGWNSIGVTAEHRDISVALVVLFHMLRDTDVDEVVSALKATSPTTSRLLHFSWRVAILR